MQSVLTSVAPVRPVAPYVGGKRVLSGRIVPIIETTPHDLYAEPFVGMGGVFLRRGRRPKAEVINDIAQDVANLFRILQRHPEALMQLLDLQLAGRTEFERQRLVDPATLTDVERAARFLYLQRVAFGGKVVGRTFGTSATAPSRFNITKLANDLQALHRRLAGVVIESLPFQDFLRVYDRPSTLFYCDPPYWGTEDYYGRALFPREAFEQLADQLRTLKGRFILSINDVPEIRRLFSWARIDEVGLTYTVGGQANARPAKELIITN